MLLHVNVDSPTQNNEQVDAFDRTASAGGVMNSPSPRVRHRLTPEQRREIGRLYSESDVSVAALRERFNVSEPSVYRILQTQGIALRGRATATATPTNGTAKRASNGQLRNQAARAGVRKPRSLTPVSRSSSNGTTQFRIEYLSERTLHAVDFHDALRQAESLGAGNIVGLTREH